MKWRLLVVAFLCIAPPSLKRAQAQSMNDSFSSNGFLDPRLWSTLSPPPTSTVTVSVSNQQLQVGMGPGIGGGGVISNCSLSGDFDVQVDYILLNWPPHNNHSIQLGAYDLGAVGVLRFSGLSPSPEMYEFGPGSTAHTTTSDTSGQFRLVRMGITLSGFFRMGGSWILVGSETVSTIPTRIHLDLGTNGTFAIGGIVVAFDNFQVNMGTPSCPQAIGLGSPGPSNPAGTFSEPITTSNGNYFYQHSDFVVPGRGLPLVFQRSYNTLDNYAGPLGANWTHTYNIVVTANSASAIVKWGDGHNEAFVFNGSSYLPQPGVFSALAKNGDGTFQLTRKDQVKFAFSTSGRLNTIQDKNGNAISLVYDGSENLKQITNAVGRSLTLTYDSNNRIVQVTDPIGRATIFGYDDINNLDHTTDPAGGTTSFAYDLNHRVITITLPNGRTLLQNAYDSSGRVVRQTGGRGFSSTLAFSTPNPTDTTITDARGNHTIHSYDSSLRIVRITDATGGVTSFTYDANNDRTSATNQNGKTTNFSYDSTGNVTGITDPLSNAIAFTYDAKNGLRTTTNPKGRTTAFTYDATENLTGIKDALTNTTPFNYDGFGELASKTDARGNTTNYAYDSFGNLTRITDALGHNTTLAYDGIGRLLSITDPKGHAATATYDPLSRLVKITDPLGNQTQFAYDSVGNLLKITDANGNATNYAYDATNNLVNVTDAMGHITRYAYDENNNRTTFTNAKGNATAYAYDVLNRLSGITDPLSFATSYSYDPVGNVLAVTDAKGQTNQFAYDALNRLLSIAYADGKHVAYSYDANGNRLSMADSHGATTYAYDALNRLTSATQPGTKVVTYVYDAVGNRKSLTYPDGKMVSYSFDPSNRLAQVTDWLGRSTTYAYDTASNLIRTNYPNHAALAFAYDDANRLIKVRNSFRNDEDDDDQRPIARLLYVLDSVGNRTQVTDGSKVTRYRYDALYELTYVSGANDDDAERDNEQNATSFSYDPVGNRVRRTAHGRSITYSYDAADRLLSADTSNFTYDANGNQTSKTQTATGQPIIYTYDAANRLVRVTGGKTNSAFAYDGDGNRIGQSVEAGAYSYLNDVATPLPVVLQESGHDGNISYAYGLGLISESSTQFDYFYHYDGLGSVVALTDASGNPSTAYAYDPWGNSLLTVPDKIGTKNKFRFTGEALDPGAQLYYLRARYYDPSIGRFVSKDPKVRPTSYVALHLNRYLYAGNDPVGNIDPEGLSFFGDIWSKATAISDTLVSGSVLSAEIFVKGSVDAVNFVTGGNVAVVNNLSTVLATGEQLAAQKLVQSEGQLAGISISQADQSSIASQVVQITNLAADALYAAKFILDAPQAISGIGKLSEDIRLSRLFGGSILRPSLTLGRDITSELLDTVGFAQTLANNPK